MADAHLSKRCLSCGEVKKESSFRYITYFHKRRKVCKQCEVRERRKKRRIVEKHVKEHGVTPGIHRRLEADARREAHQQATETVLSHMSPVRGSRYRWAHKVHRVCDLILGVVGGAIFFGLWVYGAFGWTGMIAVILTGLAALAGKRYCAHYTAPVDSDIARHRSARFEILFRKRLQERIESERFYSSPEWRILRDTFLRERRRMNGYYICYLCQGAIFDDSDVTIDHFKPRSKFPALALEKTNLRIAHRRCNSSKGDTICS